MALLAAIVVLVLSIMGAALFSSFQRSCPIDPVVLDLSPLPSGKGFSSWSRELNLQNLEKISTGKNPEDVAVDSKGLVYTGTGDGWIKTIEVDGTVKNHTYFGSTVLGVAVGPNDEIYFASPDKGLLKISNDGVTHLLSSEVDGKPFIFADGVAVAKNGIVYFTEVSAKFGLDKDALAFVESQPDGRLLKYDPSTKSTSLLQGNLTFANGVALSHNEDFLLICETARARVMRYWLDGEKKGTLEVFLDGLPGHPDNVRLSKSDGTFYIGLVAKRTAASDWLLRQPSKLLRWFGVNFFGGNLQHALLIVVSPEGNLLHKYDDPKGKSMKAVTGGDKIGDFVYFTTVGGDSIGRLKA